MKFAYLFLGIALICLSGCGKSIDFKTKIGNAYCINGEMWADWGEHGGKIISYKDDGILVNMKRQCKKVGE